MNLFKLKYHDVSEADLLKAMDSNYYKVKEAALEHPKATEEILDKGLNDPDLWLRNVAKEQLKKHGLLQHE